MRTVITLLAVLMAGCSMTRPIWHGDLPRDMCVTGPGEYTHEGVTKEYYLTVMPWPEASDYCTQIASKPATACIQGSDIYINDGVNCTKSLAHEFCHLFDMAGCDV